jgi:hypothetical protein
MGEEFEPEDPNPGDPNPEDHGGEWDMENPGEGKTDIQTPGDPFNASRSAINRT